MHKIITGILLLIALQACIHTETEAIAKSKSIKIKEQKTGVRKIALLVGVSDYMGEKKDLKGVYRDIEKMKKLFEEEGFQINILEDKDSLNVEKELKMYISQLSMKDSFIFYYSGHGSNIEDENGDESDGMDEEIVLSDGDKNEPLRDDILHNYFSRIQAKKLIIFDSCYSGTVSKSLDNEFQIKSISSESISNSPSVSKNILEKTFTNEEYIVLSSSEDNESSLSTKKGSLFTKYFSKSFSNNKSESFTSIMNTVEEDIAQLCIKKGCTPQHPKIEASNESLKKKSFREYFR